MWVSWLEQTCQPDEPCAGSRAASARSAGAGARRARAIGGARRSAHMKLERVQLVACKLRRQGDALKKRGRLRKGPPRRWIMSAALLPELGLLTPRRCPVACREQHAVLAAHALGHRAERIRAAPEMVLPTVGRARWQSTKATHFERHNLSDHERRARVNDRCKRARACALHSRVQTRAGCTHLGILIALPLDRRRPARNGKAWGGFSSMMALRRAKRAPDRPTWWMRTVGKAGDRPKLTVGTWRPPPAQSSASLHHAPVAQPVEDGVSRHA